MTLYVMLVGAYPFEDHTDPRNFSKTIKVCAWLCSTAAPLQARAPASHAMYTTTNCLHCQQSHPNRLRATAPGAAACSCVC